MQEDKFLNDMKEHFEKSQQNKNMILTQWEDERKCYIGEQNTLSFMGKKRTNRANTVDNIIFPAVEYKKYILTSSTPDTVAIMLTDTPGDYDQLDDRSKMLTYGISSILYKNHYQLIWERAILQGLMHGPLIIGVNWDGDWTGGVGQDRWVGECKINYIAKEDFFPDPAITDLEQNFQECEFVIEKQVKNLKWFKEKYPKKYDQIQVDNKKGDKSQEAPLYLYFHKGKPEVIPGEWKNIWKERLEEADNLLDRRKYQDYLDKNLNGVHLAICSEGVLLEYIPYIYEDGLYPYAYKVVHVDEQNQWGFGEIKNMIQPQILMNKVDSIEAEAYSRQGLGGLLYEAGSINAQQKKMMIENSHKGGAILEVDNLDGVEDRTPPQIPASIVNYKEYKKAIANEIVGYTGIQQGVAKSGTPYKAIQELGSRADVRTIGILKKAEMFHREVVELIISRIREFYKIERKITVNDGAMPYQMEYNPHNIMAQWDRSITDEEGETETIMEQYMPEYEVRINIIDAKPTDREYYINMANLLLERGLIDRVSYLEAVETGKIPPKETILERLDAEQAELMQQQTQQPLIQ